ncbi:DUF1345 domain-containing protein [Ralstonia insidiosa]|uniref:DUF1345 domain-containing protein n=1 Tax=Ralstonia TaxID=48736 RepID=UPI000B1AACB4|nr:DUF1345 domain-containing protein [Ralstonia insidiosa]MBX3775294.1 DUF1345 domain-containing protein [Ralstonia pickettii]NOZ14449.1 DUF1345 domain-containing protein [Betaproteobacteria bacterium]MBA9859384.1 DUF1345 domain-containing protein [Ralstonia insidiosa]MBA9872832.1 DUF1345 domain-containing protein [Ralstonia insidiosa]MBA9916027.1 DUF1345 domain-containing protein [Ralstonia insidiosa]
MNPQDESFPIPRFASSRPRLLGAFALGIVVAVLMPTAHGWLTRALLGWDVAVWTYLVLVSVMMLKADPRRIRAVARREDERASAVLAVVCLGVVASMVAIAFELVTAKSAGHAQAWHYALTGVTVVGAWLMVPMMFTVHYAHLYYHKPNEPTLVFPDREIEPDYWDFLYFSFTIAVASQTADVAIRSRAMRRAVLGQSLLSFFFNTSILALSINIAAGLFS